MLVSSATVLQLARPAYADFPVHTPSTRIAQPTTLRTAMYFVVDSSGNYFISDSNAFVKKLDSSGNFITQFGTQGSGPGQFSSTSSVGEMALDASGNVYIIDISNNRVNKFSNNGTFLSSFGSGGAGNGQFNSPNSIAIDSTGAVYVTDFGNSRVQKFTSAGVFVLAFGTAGDGNGQFRGPRPITIDSLDNIYVSDTTGSRVRAQKFTSAGTYVASYLGETSSGFCFGPGGWGIAVDSTYNVYLATVGTLCGANVHKYSNDGTRLTDLPLNLANRRIKIYSDTLYTSSNFGLSSDSIMKYSLAGTFISQLPPTSSPGKFNVPGASAQDSAGNTFVIDVENDRIQKFDPNGNFLLQFGSSGSGNGQFIYPYDITVSPNNTIYITDSSRRIVQTFDVNGQYLSQFTTDPFGITGSSTNTAIDHDSLGNIYVLARNYQVVMMAGDGTPIRQVTTSGAASSQIGNSYDLAVSADDTVYVSTSSLVKLFSPLGTHIRNINAQLNDPENSGTSKIDIDSFGNVYMLRQYSNSYVVTNNAGVLLYRVNASTVSTGFTRPRELTIGNSDRLFISDTNDYVQSYAASTIATAPGAPQNLSASASGSGVLLSWQAPLSDNGTPILKYIIDFKASSGSTWSQLVTTTDGSIRDFLVAGLTQGSYDFRISATNLAGTGQGAVLANYSVSASYVSAPSFLSGITNYPSGIAFDSQGNRYVTDSNNDNITKYDPSGNILLQFGTYGTAGGSGLLNSPTAIAVDTDGNMYVANTGNDRVEKYSPTGAYITTIGSRGTANGQFSYPNSIALDGNGSLYVVDGWNKVEKFSTDGTYIGRFASEISSPTAITIDRSTGDLYVANYPTDPEKGVYRYSNTGTQLASFGTEGEGDGQSYDLLGITIDSNGRVIVSDAYNYRLLIYTKEGLPLGQIGLGPTSGYGSGLLQFYEPSLLAIAPDNSLYVTDTYNHHFLVFSPSTATVIEPPSGGGTTQPPAPSTTPATVNGPTTTAEKNSTTYVTTGEYPQVEPTANQPATPASSPRAEMVDDHQPSKQRPKEPSKELSIWPLVAASGFVTWLLLFIAWRRKSRDKEDSSKIKH